MRSTTLASCCAIVLLASTVRGEAITLLQPRSLKPGETTTLTITGTDLNAGLRAVASSPSIAVKIDSVEPTVATVQITVPKEMPPGPFGIMFAGSSGPLTRHTLFCDDLPAVADNGQNHSVETAQPLTPSATVAGVCDASQTDWYSLSVDAGQRVAFEVHTQALGSVMDPVVRLVDASGATLYLADDNDVGPDCRFSHTFAKAGEYHIEVQDSRHAAGGSLYQLRVGDFPIVNSAFPLAAEAAQTVEVGFAGPDAALESPKLISTPLTAPEIAGGLAMVAAKFDGGHSSAWVPVAISQLPQTVEGSSESLTIPIGISGKLAQNQEADTYVFAAKKDQQVRISAKTRSLGSPALLQMQLLDPAGQKVAESAVTEADEWSFDYQFPNDGQYQLRVSDLLLRGGEAFTYWIAVTPSGSMSASFKADAAVAEQFALEPGHGAAAVDLVLTRFGLDGEIELSLSEEIAGLRILNPRIAAGAKEARIYLATDENWQPQQIANIGLVASSVSDPSQRTLVDGRALQRVKQPVILSPQPWTSGQVVLGGLEKSDSPFQLEPAAAVEFARPVNVHSATLTLKRVNPEFKAAVSLLSDRLPAGWSLTTAVDKDSYTTTLNGTNPAGEDIAVIPLTVFADFNGRGRLESYDLPIKWIDPVSVELDFPSPLARGGPATVNVRIKRVGSDPQPITLSLASPPVGVTGPEPITVAADQSTATIALQLGSEVAAGAPLSLTIASKYKEQDYTFTSEPTALPIVAGPTELSIYPERVAFGDARSRQQLVVSGVDADQHVRDWTRFASITSANSEIAAVQGGVIFPKADGETEVYIQVGAQKRTIPVQVSGMATPRPIAFESETLVALSKQGCNSGACHGSPSGKAGFRLSLRAFDMKLDELTLIREDFGRRVNVMEPEQSLMLLKPLMKIGHGGGKQLHKDDPAYQILRDWIAGGALADPEGTPRVERLEVFPHQKQILSVADGGQQLAVTAHYSDGSQRDVTELAAYETSNTSVATIDVHGFVTPHARGEIAILVRFLEHIESLPLMFVDQVEGFQWAAPTPINYIDDLVNAKLQQLQYLPSDTCTDAEFLRRASLDVTGVLPALEVTQAFLADASPDKRAKLVDSLLEREEYAKFWALKWGDLLRMTSKLVGDEGVYKYHRWVEESLKENVPYDEFAHQLLTGSGSTLANPPANFYRTATDMNECVETISQVFLGARLQCAKCHNHPFERWTQDNYYGLGAFFNRVQRRKTERPGEMFVYTSFSGDVTQPRTGQVMAPWLPQVGSIEAKDDVDRRLAFADWLTAPDNPYFARIEANRIWSQLFSRGIVDPVDDFRDSNPPSNTLLLDALAKDFVESGYDRKHLLRSILNSRTYQASYKTNAFNREDTIYFSHQEPRLLSAEQLLDAINLSLSLSQTFGSLPAGTKATQLPAPDIVKVDFLKTFGQPERSTVCACERADDSNLGMAIELFNGPMMHEKLRDEKNRFRLSIAAGKSPTEIVSELYHASVCRSPTDVELKAALDHCAKNEDLAASLEDVCWALFNTDEFLFQH